MTLCLLTCIAAYFSHLCILTSSVYLWNLHICCLLPILFVTFVIELNCNCCLLLSIFTFKSAVHYITFSDCICLRFSELSTKWKFFSVNLTKETLQTTAWNLYFCILFNFLWKSDTIMLLLMICPFMFCLSHIRLHLTLMKRTKFLSECCQNHLQWRFDKKIVSI